MTVMTCLHRFCERCIQLALRMGKKECPSCRTSCPSKRNLRRDYYFDALIEQVYPSVDEAEKAQDQIVESIIGQYNADAFVNSMEKGRTVQAMRRKTRISSKEDTKSQQFIELDSLSFEFGVSPHPTLNRSCDVKLRKYLRCQRTVTVEWLEE
eukprot:CAMPEP_0167750864 /NCGR_PEP_ID=MMETSP0110_2-20121227/6229_1 /TAXON_ID=629695 /ORGANISM="Gymnochlora sp., Strain CCMP2014" /LENGTH=152 /DNA_ID=CAMNT_0007636235 /DNA_START=99 /DNA_END=554 /DNA_ORIENTATION=+